MTKRTKQTAALGITVTALLSGLVCYRVGLLSTGCSSPTTWSMQNNPKEEEYKHASRPNYNIRHRTSSSSPQRRHRATDDDLPYNCGVVFFYHIPSTGGGEFTEVVVICICISMSRILNCTMFVLGKLLLLTTHIMLILLYPKPQTVFAYFIKLRSTHGYANIQIPKMVLDIVISNIGKPTLRVRVT